MNLNKWGLIEKLNPTTLQAVDGAAGLSMMRTHYDVELVHLLSKLLEEDRADFDTILRHFDVNRTRLEQDITAALDALRSGNGGKPDFSPRLTEALSDAWLYASVEKKSPQVRSGHLVAALLLNQDQKRRVHEISGALKKIEPDLLRDQFDDVISGSREKVAKAGAAAPTAAAAPEGGTALERFAQNLTQRAAEGRIDPVLGRDREIRQMVDILTRRRQNNPILVGEAGVGKTAVVEGFALRVEQEDVPESLIGVQIHSLDLALLQAGAGVKGEFEKRLKSIIEEVKSSPIPIILFIDEAHTLIGAGGQAGQGDAANLLKPALARGELRTVAATTWAEYKQYFEEDAALTRRFQVVKVDEPTEDLCCVMMRGVVPILEEHHGVSIRDSGMQAAVRLSARYLSERQLPDKAVSVLDTACARLALGQNATPPGVEYATRKLDDLRRQERVLEREMNLGAAHGERLEEVRAGIAEAEQELEQAKERWDKERALVGRIRAVIETLERGAPTTDGQPSTEASDEASDEASTEPSEGTDADEASDAVEGSGTAIDADALRAELRELEDELRGLQGDDPLVPVTVDGDFVGEIISGWTGIPVGKMMQDELTTALTLEERLQERIVGQDHALEIVSHRIRTSHAGMEDPSKPKGVFLFVGPSGVGKTETALALTDLLYGGEQNLISINMSEYQEAISVATLKGAPPGYKGYGKGGYLTEAVRRRPYSVVLLDEIEKAHADVLEMFFQVFDKGQMDDSAGKRIDFKNTIIILTSNVGTDTIMSLCADPETRPGWQGLVKALKPELDAQFKPAFLGRTVIAPFYPILDEALDLIIRLKMRKVARRISGSHGIALDYEDAVVSEIASRCTEVESGARNIDNILTNTVLPDLSRLVLESMMQGSLPNRVVISVGDAGSFEYEPSAPVEAVGLGQA